MLSRSPRCGAGVKEQIRTFIEHGGDFEKLALDVYGWQRSHNDQYDRFCGDIDVRSWQEIPAVPSTLFRDLALTCFPPEDAQVTFRTSGTTNGVRGCVRLQDTELYDLASRRHAEACIGPIPKHGVSFTPTAIDSSLGHMCSRFTPGMSNHFSANSGVSVNEGWQAIQSASNDGHALFIPGTAFALADLMNDSEASCEVPPGSIVMVTGGFKGRTRQTTDKVLYSTLAHRLRGAQIVGEYGMSELSSQLWAVPAGSPYRPPPWMRVQAVDPWTGQPTTRGLLRFYDLANHQTVIAIETQDVGVVHSNGDVTLEGRLVGATPRGCSLSVEEANG
jgi:hypothetical protein